MGQIKLIALDMDGTLLDPEDNVSEANREAIFRAQQKGVHVVLSTGRFIESTSEYAEMLGLTSYLVTSNGGEIWDERRRRIERHLLPNERVGWMRDLAQKKGARYWGTSTERVWRWDEFPDDPTTYEWLKFGFSTENDRIREEIWASLLATNELEVTNSSPTNIEVNKIGVNKATALSKVCRRLNFTMDAVLAVGDSLNDLAMIRAAGCGVAMGNAQQQVKEQADWVTGTNEDDGVAQAIQRWVFKENVI